jgi:predicted DNA-binding transcriptional regulator AlpA
MTSATPHADRVLTVEQVYDLLQLSGAQRCMSTLGECPRAKLADGTLRFSERAVLAWIAAGAQRAGSTLPSRKVYGHGGKR